MSDFSRAPRRLNVRGLAVTAMLSAVTAVLAFTPLGMIPLPAPLPSPTTVHIPVLLCAMLQGPAAGLFTALVFGVCSLIRAYMSPVGLNLFFMDPLVAILPRLLIPLAAAYAFRLARRLTRRDAPAAVIAAFLGTLTNTVFSLGAILVLHGAALSEMVAQAAAVGGVDAAFARDAARYLLVGIAVPYGLSESVAAAVIAPAVMLAVRRVVKPAYPPERRPAR